jgi:ComF family protein
MVYNWLSFIHSRFYPYSCSLCGADSSLKIDLCKDCLDDLVCTSSACIRCGLPLPGQSGSSFCGQCLRKPPQYHGTFAAFTYNTPLTGLITQLKFSGKIQLARVLAEAWLQRYANTDIPLPEAILPVPLHWRRIWSRGYNQALEIARPLARHFNLPVLNGYVQRTRHTAAQSSLVSRQRKANVRGCFKLARRIPYERIAIVDDVVTTGSTVQELARVLAAEGIREIYVWCIARAMARHN